MWLDYARDCGYLDASKRDELAAAYEEIGRMLGGVIDHPKRFVPRDKPRS